MKHIAEPLRMYLLIVFYGLNVIYFYCYLVYPIAQSVAIKCSGYRQCSRHYHPGYDASSTLLAEWIGPYRVDLADGQWRDFRSSLLLLCAALLGTAFLHQMVKRFSAMKDRVRTTAILRLVFGTSILVVQHGAQSLVVVAIALIGYYIARLCRGRKYLAPICCWGFALFVLLLKESYRLRHWAGRNNYNSLSFALGILFNRTYGGMYSWHLPANFLVLRILSFGLDMHRSVTITDDADAKKHDDAPPSDSVVSQENHAHVATTTQSRPLDDYNLLNFISYTLYAPLYMAGPIITFDSFMQCTVSPEIEESVLVYAFRWGYCFALLEFLTSQFPVFAVVSSGMLPYLTVAEIAVVMYVTLKMMWIKFLVIWRFFRLWALVDGVCPPENMKRCMSNNSGLGEFWKGWHSSFNQWIVRYMYMPLGGRSTSLYNVWPIFLFVALWHDIEPKLIAWGLLNALFFVVELAGQHFAATSPAIKALPRIVFNFICALSGATYIMILIGVNMIGYSIGIGGVSQVLQKLLTGDGIRVLAVSYYFLFIGIKVMSLLKDLGLSSKK